MRGRTPRGFVSDHVRWGRSLLYDQAESSAPQIRFLRGRAVYLRLVASKERELVQCPRLSQVGAHLSRGCSTTEGFLIDSCQQQASEGSRSALEGGRLPRIAERCVCPFACAQRILSHPRARFLKLCLQDGVVAHRRS